MIRATPCTLQQPPHSIGPACRTALAACAASFSGVSASGAPAAAQSAAPSPATARARREGASRTLAAWPGRRERTCGPLTRIRRRRARARANSSAAGEIGLPGSTPLLPALAYARRQAFHNRAGKATCLRSPAVAHNESGPMPGQTWAVAAPSRRASRGAAGGPQASRAVWQRASPPCALAFDLQLSPVPDAPRSPANADSMRVGMACAVGQRHR